MQVRILLITIALSACGSDSSGAAAGSGPTVSCASGQFAVAGTLDSKDAAISVTGMQQLYFANKLSAADPGMLNVNYGYPKPSGPTNAKSPAILATFSTLVPNGQTVPANVRVNIPGVGVRGNCDSDGEVSDINVLASDQYVVHLKNARENADCSKPVLSGEIAVCYSK